MTTSEAGRKATSRAAHHSSHTQEKQNSIDKIVPEYFEKTENMDLQTMVARLWESLMREVRTKAAIVVRRRRNIAMDRDRL